MSNFFLSAVSAADGWFPSLPRLPLGPFGDGQSRLDDRAAHDGREPRDAPSPTSIPPEALMRVGFIRPRKQGVASHLLTLQQFASEVIPPRPEAGAAERGRNRTGERP